MSLLRAIAGLIDDSTYRTIRVDPATHALQVAPIFAAAVAAGNVFYFDDIFTLGSGAIQNYVITTPNTTRWARFIFNVSGTNVTTVELYEATDRAGTTLQTVFNRNRNSATANTTTLHSGTTGGATDGTLIARQKFGVAGKGSDVGTGGDASGVLAFVLKQNTKYILRITSGAADNDIDVFLVWGESTDKN